MQTARVIGPLTVHIKPTDVVGSLTVARQQMVEIAKALSYDAKVLVMDDPHPR